MPHSSSSHSEKYFSKLFISFVAITGSVLVIFYSIFQLKKDDGYWYAWAIISAILLCIGIYFCLQAAVHKVKSDLSKRQRMREQQQTFTADAR